MSGVWNESYYASGPCQEFYLNHVWEWTEDRRECKRCGEVAHARRFTDVPCMACGEEIESVIEVYFCKECLRVEVLP